MKNPFNKCDELFGEKVEEYKSLDIGIEVTNRFANLNDLSDWLASKINIKKILNELENSNLNYFSNFDDIKKHISVVKEMYDKFIIGQVEAVSLLYPYKVNGAVRKYSYDKFKKYIKDNNIEILSLLIGGVISEYCSDTFIKNGWTNEIGDTLFEQTKSI
jgi:hypothetical protein